MNWDVSVKMLVTSSTLPAVPSKIVINTRLSLESLKESGHIHDIGVDGTNLLN
jgi:hypothetical protein